MGTKGIGIVGAGIAGLHLGLYLQQQGVPVTLYAERAAEDVRAGRVLNSVTLWRDTRERERRLGVNHWDDLVVPGHDESYGVHCGYMVVGPPDGPIRFTAPSTVPGLPVDHRVVLPRYQEDFEERGGRVEIGPVAAETLEALSERHDLVVVCTGKYSLTGLFPPVAEHCPYDRPQLILTLALVEGFTYPHPTGVFINIVPGVGTIFAMPLWTFDGPREVILFEAAPGGPVAGLAGLRYDDDPALFTKSMLAALDEHAPAVMPQVDRSAFRVVGGPLGVLQGGVTPIVRRPWARLDNGRCVMGLGDVHTAFDPIFAQGANAASAGAFILGDEIVASQSGAGSGFDEAFCTRVGDRLWESARPAMEWTNVGVAPGPAPAHWMEWILAAAADPVIARRLFDNFSEPDVGWGILSTPEATRAYLAQFAAAADLQPPNV